MRLDEEGVPIPKVFLSDFLQIGTEQLAGPHILWPLKENQKWRLELVPDEIVASSSCIRKSLGRS